VIYPVVLVFIARNIIHYLLVTIAILIIITKNGIIGVDSGDIFPKKYIFEMAAENS